MYSNLGNIFARSAPDTVAHPTTKAPRYRCGISKVCPEKHFAFKIASGAANVVGPKICVDDNILMSGVKNNVGRGINTALVNGKTGALIETTYHDLWGGGKCKDDFFGTRYPALSEVNFTIVKDYSFINKSLEVIMCI
ncbi:hypothetical protein XENTR_v10008674 [Xenopus tropicalis]|nr:hypothetical protein XENTR_v10008674 [Xenopus tropicalis]